MAATPLAMPTRRPATSAELAAKAPVRLAYTAQTGDRPRPCRHMYEDLVRQWMECVHCGRLEVRDDWK